METETATRWLTDAEQCAWRTHLEVNRLLTYQLEKDLQPFGLTMNDYEILVNLSESEGVRMRMSDLASATLQSKSRLSHQITRMENADLVRRENCESDRRGLGPIQRTVGNIEHHDAGAGEGLQPVSVLRSHPGRRPQPGDRVRLRPWQGGRHWRNGHPG